MLVYQAAERTVHDAVACLLRSYSQSKDRASAQGADHEGDQHPRGPATRNSFEFSTGVPTLCRLLEYLLSVVKETTDSASKQEGVPSSSSASQRSSGTHRRSLSQQQHVPYQPPLNEVSFDRSTLHLLFALKTISRLLSVAGNGAVVRDLLVR